jgi:lactate 2-monooxygenase
MMDEPDHEAPTKKSISLKSIRGLISMVSRYPGSNFFSKLISGRPIKAVQKFVSTYTNPSLQWSDLQYLRDQTGLPILLKGVLHPEDAQKAIEFGINGIIVSNHGGRQVDGSISAIDALPEIVNAVHDKIPVLIDSGIRGGGDVFKALALGATAVCIGRPYAYGLALAGERGVYDVLNNFMADFELTMALAGCKNVAEINPDMVAKIQ